MSLPPGFTDELRSRVSLAEIAGRRVTWDERKSNRGRGDLWAPCPFHQEKTASFHVDDGKGFYYCFGCHAKGDVFNFVMETENLGFMEAVESLAQQAGLAMPQRDAAETVRQKRRADLVEINERAVAFFRKALGTREGAAARDYLGTRGLAPASLERFEIGYAPGRPQALWQHLRSDGIPADDIAEAGLAIVPDSGGTPYDRFRNRVIYPIRDERGRCVAFGGRAVAHDAMPKYLNSPETPVFDKSSTLYNIGPARSAIGKAGTLIVAEGYMDVIALVEAGFDAAVAPLGTAITESQLKLMWRVAPEPVITLDGDRAGLRAAERLIDLALPLLQAGQGLRFCLMPPDTDPDDLLRREGAAEFARRLAATEPMVALLWRREVEGREFDSPERRAGLDKSLDAAVARIRDAKIRHHYISELKRLKWEKFGPRARPRKGGPRNNTATETASSAARGSRLAGARSDAQAIHLREAVILATLLRHPTLLPRFEAELERLDFSTPEHTRLKDALFSGAPDPGPGFSARIREEIGGPLLDSLFAQTHVAIAPGVSAAGDEKVAAASIAEELKKLEAHRGLAREIEEATEDVAAGRDDHVFYRLAQARAACDAADRQLREDEAEFELGANGARISRAEREAFEALIRETGYSGEVAETPDAVFGEEKMRKKL